MDPEYEECLQYKYKQRINAINSLYKETLEKWHKDPNNWKWGSFYFNKEDHRLFPPKRIPWM